jgi:hypothetical protein
VEPERKIGRVRIFADESANWQIAGLRQIERLIFGLEELAARQSEFAPDQVEVVWDPKLDPAARRLPERRYAPGLEIREGAPHDNEDPPRLTTRLLVKRGSLGGILSRLNGGSELPEAIDDSCRLLSSPADLPAAEAWFMKSLGKCQDGWVARHLDRHISIRLSRWLIRLGARPIHATIAALLFGLAGCAILLRGDYASILIGTIVIYGFSVLDGCDGEIARACYLDSESGRRMDLFVDTLVNILFLVCLGLGLGRFWEGLAAALLIGASEGMLATIGSGNSAASPPTNSRYYARHAEMLGRSGAHRINPRLVHFFAQVTKRDVGWVAFIVLAAIGAPAFILHLSLGVGIIVAGVAALALIRRPAIAPA